MNENFKNPEELLNFLEKNPKIKEILKNIETAKKDLKTIEDLKNKVEKLDKKIKNKEDLRKKLREMMKNKSPEEIKAMQENLEIEIGILKNEIIEMFKNLNINKYQKFLPKATEIQGDVFNERILADEIMFKNFNKNPYSFVNYFLWNKEIYTEETGITTTTHYDLFKNAIEDSLALNRGDLFWNFYNSIVLNGPEGLEDLKNILETISEHVGINAFRYSEEDKLKAGKAFDEMPIEEYTKTILNRLKMEGTAQDVDLKNVKEAIEEYKKLAEDLKYINLMIETRQEKLKEHTSLIKKVSRLLNKIFSGKEEVSEEKIKKITQILKINLKKLKDYRLKILKDLEKYKVIIDKGLNSDNPEIRDYIKFLIEIEYSMSAWGEEIGELKRLISGAKTLKAEYSQLNNF